MAGSAADGMPFDSGPVRASTVPRCDAEFLARKRHLSTRKFLASLVANWRVVTLGAMLVSMSTSFFYLITVYTPTFGRSVLRLSEHESLTLTMTVGVSNFLWLPLMGAVSDRVGRRPLLFGSAILTLATIPTRRCAWLDRHGFILPAAGVELWMSALYGTYNAAMVVYLTELIPAEVRASDSRSPTARRPSYSAASTAKPSVLI